MLSKLLEEINLFSNKEKAEVLQRFFKTWIWQYWEGDLFHWIIVPIQRQLAKKYYAIIKFEEIEILLKSKYHEERLIWTIILVYKFEKTKSEENKKRIFEFYIKNSKWINNWDLVDLSAPNIVWNFLLDKNRDLLYEMVLSENLWQRRIAVLSTFTFIRNWDFKDIIQLIKKLLSDKEDLIHKACWWMLREIWKRDEKVLIDFLNENVNLMPRTMLRYAIERFPPEIRLKYLCIKQIK